MVLNVTATPTGALVAVDPQAFVEEDACWHQVQYRGGVRTYRCVKVEIPK
jgi:hypothetical protein